MLDVTKPDSAAVPTWKLNQLGVEFPAWGADGRTVHWSLGNALFTYDLDAAADDPDYEPSERQIAVSAERDIPQGTVVLRGARAITMDGDEIVSDADIVVTNNRIASVTAGPGDVPEGATVIDVSGQDDPSRLRRHARAHVEPVGTALGAAVDLHPPTSPTGSRPRAIRQTATTDVLSYEDMVRAGRMVGPRVYSTGPGVFSRDYIRSYEHARDVLTKYSRYYDTKTFKMYMSGNRRQRQWLIMAARELELMPTTEGGLDYRLNLTPRDGRLPGDRAHHADHSRLRRRGGAAHDVGDRQHAHDARVVRRTVGRELLLHARGRIRRREADALHTQARARHQGAPAPDHGTGARRLVHGGRVRLPQARRVAPRGSWRLAAGSESGATGRSRGWASTGSCGPCRWATWTSTTRSARPRSWAPRRSGWAATWARSSPASWPTWSFWTAIPLADIRNTNTIHQVMMNGRLYDGDTMDEIWPRQRPAPDEPWRNTAPDVRAGIRGGGR